MLNVPSIVLILCIWNEEFLLLCGSRGVFCTCGNGRIFLLYVGKLGVVIVSLRG